MHIIKNVFMPIGTGLIVAQLIATVFVFISNLEVHELVRAAHNNGYFAIPHGKAADMLTTWGAAIWGGLFYTLSVGVGLTLTMWALWHLWALVFKQHRRLAIAFLILPAILLVAINRNGPTLFPTLFCLLVPLATLGMLYKFASPPSRNGRHNWIIPAVVLGLLTTLWASQMNQNLFIAIRDHLLLSNPAGRVVNDFYYRYTLFAAQSFKSVYQKTLRAYRADAAIDKDVAQKINNRLERIDVLQLPELRTSDMTVSISKKNIVLTGRRGSRVEGELTTFFKKPYDLLKSFSKEEDRYQPLRRLTLYGLLFGFPILLYIVVYGGLRIGMGQVLGRLFGASQRTATIAAALVCLSIGIGLFWPMRTSSPRPLAESNIAAALAADNWPKRVAALRQIEKQELDLVQYPQYRNLLSSKLPVERYWLARSLAISRAPSTYADLLSLLDDNHPNVRCQVYYALGRRGNRTAIDLIKKQMIDSDHWYAQWYGYRALRRLGWHQGQSDS